MAPQKFGGSTSLTDAHDTIQDLAGNATWLCEYVPMGEDRIAVVLLWLCHSVGLCCSIVCEYAMYKVGKLESHPNSIDLYVASPQTRSSEIDVLLQEQPSANFAWGVSVSNYTRYGPCPVEQCAIISGTEGKIYTVYFGIKK